MVRKQGSKVSEHVDSRARAHGAKPTSALARLVQRARDSAWASLLGKALVGVVVFAALALVGSGQALGWLPSRASPTVQRGVAAPVGGPHAIAAVVPAVASAPASSAPRPAEVADADAGAAAPPAGASALTPDGKVILNLASETELRRLPSIGAKRAHSIVELRTRLGRLRRVEDLLRVKGIGRKLLARLRPLVLVDPPSTPGGSSDAPTSAQGAAPRDP